MVTLPKPGWSHQPRYDSKDEIEAPNGDQNLYQALHFSPRIGRADHNLSPPLRLPHKMVEKRNCLSRDNRTNPHPIVSPHVNFVSTADAIFLTSRVVTK